MKKYLFYSMMVAIALCTTACNKNKSDVEDKSQDPNPYPYLRISDVEIYYEKTISEAEDIIYKNGYKGGFLSEKEGYKYAKENDTIWFDVSDEDIVRTIIYTSAIKANLKEVKGWLLHPTETYQGKYPLKFQFCSKYPDYSIIEDFKIYENNINLLSSKEGIDAIWLWSNNDSTRYVIGHLFYNVGETEVINATLWYGDDPLKPQPEPEIPIFAYFTYEVEKLTVSFINGSRGNHYFWDFGDGETSTEENPIHTYAHKGEYNVVVTATNKDGSVSASYNDSVSLYAITIDGSFDDWEKAINAGTAVYTKLEEGEEYEVDDIKAFAAYMDEDFVYFMLAFEEWEVRTFDIFFGCSGEMKEPVAACVNFWEPMYCDYMIELGNSDNDAWDDWNYCTLFKFNHEIGGWNYDPDSFTDIAHNVCSISDRGNWNISSQNELYFNDASFIEGKIARSNFANATSAYYYICCLSYDMDWNVSGKAPVSTMKGGVTIAQPQLKLLETE